MAQCQLYCEDVRIVLSSININLDNYTYSPIIRLRQKGVNTAQTPLVIQWLRLQASSAMGTNWIPHDTAPKKKKKKIVRKIFLALGSWQEAYLAFVKIYISNRQRKN